MGASKMDDADLWKCIAGTVALKINLALDVDDDIGTWGVFTNGTEWKFIRIGSGRSYNDDEEVFNDFDGDLWCSKAFNLDLSVYNHKKVVFIYRALYYFVRKCYELSEDFLLEFE